MSHAHKLEKIAVVPAHDPLPHEVSVRVKARVEDYWRRLWLADAALIAYLAEECLHRARKRMGRGNEQEFLMRSLEEAQRRFDHALARALHLPASNDAHALAAARAAFLLSGGPGEGDALFRAGDPAPELKAKLQAILPRSTPPEAHRAMPPAPLRFWLFKSPPHP